MTVFRSRQSVGIENEAKKVSEVEKEWAHAAPGLGRLGPPLSLLGTPFRQVFFPLTFISIKNDFHKISRNSEKLSNTKVTFIDLELLKLLGPLLLFLPVFVNSMFPLFQRSFFLQYNV